MFATRFNKCPEARPGGRCAAVAAPFRAAACTYGDDPLSCIFCLADGLILNNPNIDRHADSGFDFEARWLAETVRLTEQRLGAFDDRDALRVAREVPGDAERRIVARGAVLAEAHGLDDAVRSWRMRGKWVALSLAVLGALAGFGAAIAALGDGQRAVNVIWLLGALLGLNWLSLLFWGASAWFGRRVGGERAAGGLSFGRLWLVLARRLAVGEAAAQAARALGGLMARARLVPWWTGVVSHGVWLAISCGALVGLLAALATRSYLFVWETTILPADTFVGVVAGLGWLPAHLGFTVPAEATVRASGLATLGGMSGMRGLGEAWPLLGDESVRRAWSSWLIGCLVTYGITPRLALWLLCGAGLVARLRGVRLDLALPGYAVLVARLTPASERLGVSDAAPAALPRARAGLPHAVAGKRVAVVGIELRPDVPWPPATTVGVTDAGVLDDRAQRHNALAMLAADPPARLLVVCDARLSPDRGTFSLISALSLHAGDCRVGLWHGAQPGDAGAERLAHWRQGLHEAGLPPYAVFEDARTALRWLEQGDD